MDEEIVKEVKNLLTYDTWTDRMIGELKEVCKTWYGKEFNHFRLYTPQLAFDSIINKYIESGDILEFNVSVNSTNREIHLTYRKHPNAYYETIYFKIG